MKTSIAIAIHGGAGTIDHQEMTSEKESAYRSDLKLSLETGSEILRRGGDALEAVAAAVSVLEDSPLYNAGRGAVFTADGKIELDASVMRGIDLEAGAVCAVRGVKNPVQLAVRVLLHSQHVMLCGSGAEEFARLQQLTFMPPAYFETDLRKQQLHQVKGTDITMLDHGLSKPIGTVGAVACDIHGNVAAATSTGGMTNKKFGRVGDTPVIGAGTYANNHTCAVSCTGHGEYFIRTAAAFQVHSRMALLKENIDTAARYIIHKVLMPMGGEGGLIAIDKSGNISMPFNSPGMYRGYWKNDNIYTEIYGDGGGI